MNLCPGVVRLLVDIPECTCIFVLSFATRSAAGGSGSTGGVDVKMLAEQNLQLKEALKRLHNHSISEKTEVSHK